MTTFLPQKVFLLRHFWADFRLRLSWVWFLKQLCSFALIFVLAIGSYNFVTHFLFQSVCVSGISMYPTLANAGNYWLNRTAYFSQSPTRDDIVAIKEPNDGTLIVKRIIALPGESVYLRHGKVYVNNRLLDEAYLPARTLTFAYEENENEFFCCGKDQYFVLGDNRGNSTDSRVFGPVPREDILGKVTE
jgi:signal peptidase I